MARHALAFGLALTTLFFGACGLSLRGEAEPAGSNDAGASPTPMDASLGTGDAPEDAGTDACGPIVIEDDFNAGVDGGTWTMTGLVAASKDADRHVILIPEGFPYTASSLFSKTPHAMGSFVATFRFRLTGLVGGGDGLAFAWLNASATDLGPRFTGSAFGLPGGANGWAFAVDTYTNPTTTNDPPTPHYALLALVSGKEPGTYDWHKKTTPRLDPTPLGAWHTTKITNLAGTVTIEVDGALILTESGITPTRGAVGFAAGTGAAAPLGASVGNLAITTANPACPSRFP